VPTIDLSTPPPPPAGRLEGLPRRASLTLPELRLAAELAGGAPLPFDLQETDPAASPIEARLGATRGTAEDRAYRTALEALHDPAATLTRRGLLTEGRLEEQLAGAVGLLATPQIALDLDLVAGGVQAKSWQRHSEGAVATLSTADGIVFELAWFPVAHWAGELARVPVLPEDLALSASAVPARLVLPYELLDAATEATRESRPDLLPVLLAQHPEAISTDGDPGTALGEAEALQVLAALSHEAQGRLRALVAQVGPGGTTVAGVVSWTLLADGWHALRARDDGPALVVEIEAVQADQLGRELAPVLTQVLGEGVAT